MDTPLRRALLLAPHQYGRRYGDQSFKPGESDTLADELADILWVVMAIANQTGTDLADALRRNIDKKTARDSRRHIDNPKLT